MKFSKIPDNPAYTANVSTWLKQNDYDFLCKLQEEQPDKNVLQKMIERGLMLERRRKANLGFDKDYFYKEIDPERELIQFDGVSVVSVYKGWIDEMVPVSRALEWRPCDYETCEMLCLDAFCLTLNEIREQVQQITGEEKVMINVFIDGPLHGAILHYGNCGDRWVKLGDYSGYA